MQINIHEESVLSYTLKQERETKGNDNRTSLVSVSDTAATELNKSDSSRHNETGLRTMDRINISDEARALQKVVSGKEYQSEDQQESLGNESGGQKSTLHDVAAGTGGPAASQKDDMTFSEAVAPEGAKPKSNKDKLKELQEQLRDAQEKLAKAQKKLEEAQAEMASSDEDAMGGGQAKVDAAQAEVNAAVAEMQMIQQKIMEILNEQGGGGGGGIAGRRASGGGGATAQKSVNSNNAGKTAF